MENKALFVEQNEGSHVIRTLSLFRPIIHPHQMYEVTEELKGENYCSGCRLLIACEECRDICYGFIYFCEQCNFKLDMKCAALTIHKIGVLEEKITGRVTELHHFTHPHKLALANFNDPKHKRQCHICGLQILGPAYLCPERYCLYILHESCLRLPQKIRVPFHPNHMLVNRLLPTSQQCYACTLELGIFAYSCEHCDFNLHVEDNIETRKNIHEERFRKELENLVARPPIEEVIQAGVVPRFVELLGSPNDYVREQAVLALGNIAAVSLRCRDVVLGHGALLPLLALLNEPVSPSMLRNATWTLSRFCKPPFDQVKLVLPTLAHLIHSKDEVVLAKACRVLSYFSDGTNDKIQAVIEAGVLGRLAELLMHPSYSVITPALYTVKHIVTDVQIQAIIEANITAPLVHLLQIAESDIHKQATKAISNATSGGTHDQIRFLVSQGCIKSLCDFLYYADEPETIAACLQGLENILKVVEADKNMGITGGVNLYAQMIDAAGGREKIKILGSLKITEFYEKAVELLKTYW
ncbi:Armadillo [Gossypium australe]|uniref:Armadillo n=1 Tax=Gossypium australe TaxID=47621 RepID=A0A5B6VTZ9_9ROSI|nr:Armadillo [Gossypium australe]